MSAAVEFVAASYAVGGKALLDDVSLRIDAGERVALIGPSGAGKTTLLRLIAGLSWPTAGSVRALGEHVDALRGGALRRFRRRVGFLHQDDNLVPQLRVGHNVLMGRLGSWSTLRSLWSLLRPQQLERAHAALRSLELGGRLWAMPDELSGGEQQRVAVARLIVQQPELVLADEPVSALDARLGLEVLRKLFDLAAAPRALVVSLHAIDLLDAGFDRVVAMRGGRVVHDDAPAAFDRARLQQLYGGDLPTSARGHA